MNAQNQASFELSPLHASLRRVARLFDAGPLNAIVNDPGVLPHIGGPSDGGTLDLSGFVQDSSNIALYDDGAAAMFNRLAPGLYEVHSMALPHRRGAHVARCAKAFLHIMFCRTDAIEIVTRVPDGNVPALALAKLNHFRQEFRTPTGWITPQGPAAVNWYRLGLVEWASAAPGLVERGRWFHEEIEAACERHGVTRAPHPEDSTHNRYAGLACEMILGGQIAKGIHFLNRHGAITRAAPVRVLSADPLIIHIGDIAVAVDVANQVVDIVKAQ